MLKVTLGVMVLSLMVALGASPAWAGEAVPLNDTQLDAVYGGEDPNDPNLVIINTHCATCTLDISGNQTGNSAILINAVGSTVSAQLNIMVYNDNLGVINQKNVGFTSAP